MKRGVICFTAAVASCLLAHADDFGFLFENKQQKLANVYLDDLVGNSYEERFEAMQFFKRTRLFPNTVIPLLVSNVSKFSEADAVEAVYTIANYGTNAAAAIPYVTNLLDSASGLLGNSVRYCLSRIDPPRVVPLLILELRDGNDSKAQLAARLLGEVGEEARAAVPALLTCAQTGKTAASDAAVVALGRIACRPELVVSNLVQLLDVSYEQRTHVRLRSVVDALGSYGPGAKDAVIPLQRLQERVLLWSDWLSVSNALVNINEPSVSRGRIERE